MVVLFIVLEAQILLRHAPMEHTEEEEMELRVADRVMKLVSERLENNGVGASGQLKLDDSKIARIIRKLSRQVTTLKNQVQALQEKQGAKEQVFDAIVVDVSLVQMACNIPRMLSREPAFSKSPRKHLKLKMTNRKKRVKMVSFLIVSYCCFSQSRHN